MFSVTPSEVPIKIHLRLLPSQGQSSNCNTDGKKPTKLLYIILIIPWNAFGVSRSYKQGMKVIATFNILHIYTTFTNRSFQK